MYRNSQTLWRLYHLNSSYPCDDTLVVSVRGGFLEIVTKRSCISRCLSLQQTYGHFDNASYLIRIPLSLRNCVMRKASQALLTNVYLPFSWNSWELPYLWHNSYKRCDRELLSFVLVPRHSGSAVVSTEYLLCTQSFNFCFVWSTWALSKWDKWEERPEDFTLDSGYTKFKRLTTLKRLSMNSMKNIL